MRPAPFLIDRWPEWTHPTTTDVIVSGVSLLRLVEVTPDGVLVLDADLTRIQAHAAEARLIGRASTAHSVPWALRDGPTLTLPADVRAGDLVAIPCRGAVCRRELRVAGAPLL